MEDLSIAVTPNSPPEYVAKIAIPFRDAFGEKFVQGKVISLDVPNKKVRRQA